MLNRHKVAPSLTWNCFPLNVMVRPPPSRKTFAPDGTMKSSGRKLCFEVGVSCTASWPLRPLSLTRTVWMSASRVTFVLTLMLQCLRSASVVRTSAGVLGERVGTAIAGARVLGGSEPGYIVNCVGPNELSEPTNPSSEASADYRSQQPVYCLRSYLVHPSILKSNRSLRSTKRLIAQA